MDDTAASRRTTRESMPSSEQQRIDRTLRIIAGLEDALSVMIVALDGRSDEPSVIEAVHTAVGNLSYLKNECILAQRRLDRRAQYPAPRREHPLY